jgi:hypothetical protein
MEDRSSSSAQKQPEWDDAWDLVGRLEAARNRLSDEPAIEANAAVAEHVSPPLANETIDPDELARAIADIEQAAAALRRAEPPLEAAYDFQAAPAPVPSPRKVWILIGALWASTILVTAGVIATIISLLG